MVNILTPLFRKWMMSVGEGGAPQHIIYMRDGISEGLLTLSLMGNTIIRDINNSH